MARQDVSRALDWPRLYKEYSELARRKRFVWGEFDCCLMAADWIKYVSGVDVAEPFRDRYSDARGAWKALRDYCDGGVPQLCDRIVATYTIDEVKMLTAFRADIALVDYDGRESLGIVDVGRIMVPTLPTGVVTVPIETGTRFFHIPFHRG